MEALRNLKKSFRALKWYEWAMAAVMALIAVWAMAEAFLFPRAGGNPPWLTIVNFFSAIAGIFCVFFCAKASVSNFFFGLVNTLAYIVYLWHWRIWGTMVLELFLYLPMGIIGWLHWVFSGIDQPEVVRFVDRHKFALGLSDSGGVIGNARDNWMALWK